MLMQTLDPGFICVSRRKRKPRLFDPSGDILIFLWNKDKAHLYKSTPFPVKRLYNRWDNSFILSWNPGTSFYEATVLMQCTTPNIAGFKVAAVTLHICEVTGELTHVRKLCNISRHAMNFKQPLFWADSQQGECQCGFLQFLCCNIVYSQY